MFMLCHTSCYIMFYNMSCYFMVYKMSFLCYITCHVHVMLYLLYNMYCFVTLYNIFSVML